MKIERALLSVIECKALFIACLFVLHWRYFFMEHHRMPSIFFQPAEKKASEIGALRLDACQRQTDMIRPRLGLNGE